MYYLRLIYEVLLALIIVLTFIVLFYYRFKAVFIRLKLKREGIIKNKGLLVESLLNLGFWVVPLLKYKKIGDQYHNRYVNKSNLFLLLFIVFSFLLLLTHNILW
jgi:hypothetical protein